MKLVQRFAHLSLLGCTGFALVACSGGTNTVTPTTATTPAATISSIDITGPTANHSLSLPVGNKTSLAVTASYSDNSTQADTGVTYALANVSPAGSITISGAQITAVAAGSATVIATDTASGKVSSAYTVTSTAPAVTLTSIAITTPASGPLNLTSGSTSTLVTSSTNSLSAVAVDSAVSYALSNVSPAGCVTVSGSTITAVAAGSATVIATDTGTGLVSAPLTVSVMAAPVISIAITTPATSPLALTVGQTSTLAVTATHSGGATASDTAVTYALSNVSPAGAVTASGSTLTAAAVGTAKVTATDTGTGLTSAPVTINVTAAPATAAVFQNNYASGVAFTGFDGANSTPVMTVDSSTTNPANSLTASLKIVVPSSNPDNYVGGILLAATPQNLSAFNALTFWAKTNGPTTTTFKVGIGQDGSATTTAYQAEVIGFSITSAWKKFVVPLPNPSKFAANSGLFYFADGDNNYTVWLNDIQYETLSPAPVASSAVGNFPSVSVPAGSTSTALSSPNGSAPNTIGFSGLPSGFENNVGWGWYTLTSSNPAAATVSNTGLITGVAAGTSTITATMGSIAVSGSTSVTVTAAAPPPSGPTAPTAAAAAPANPVLFSILTNSGSDIAGTDFFPNWGQATQYSATPVAGVETAGYTVLNYEGIQFASNLNVSTASHIHIDVWTPNVTSLGFDLISPGPAQFQSVNSLSVATVATAGWNSIDLPLSTFTGVDLTNLIQLSFTALAPTSGGTIYVQNIYFW